MKIPALVAPRRGVAGGHWCRLAAVGLGLVVPAISAVGQEALRQSLAGQDAAAELRKRNENQPYNLRWRDLTVQLGATWATEWNDNVSQTESAPQRDFILRPTISLGAHHPIGRFNAIHLSTDFGYEKHVDFDQYDRWTVSPGSSLEFDVFFEDVRLNVHDRFAYDHSPSRSAAVSGSGEFGGFDNQAGVLATWDLHDLVLRVGYDSVLFLASADEFKRLNRLTHNFTGQSEFQLLPSLNGGLELAGGPTDYEQALLNDNVSLSAGLFAKWRVSEHIEVESRGGYSHYSFSDTPTLSDLPDADGYYLGFAARHQVNPWLNYGVDANRSIQLGVNSNLQELWIVSLGPSFRVVRGLELSPRVVYENGEESSGAVSQEFERIGFTLGLQYRFARKVSTGVSYSFLSKESNLAGFGYTQNRIVLSLSYQF